MEKLKLQEIKEKYNVDQVWSWSKYKTYRDDKYMFYLKYILRVIEDMPNSRYSFMGEISHKILQDTYEEKLKYEDMLEKFEDGILEADIKNLKYDRTNEEKNKRIAKNYEDSLRLFFKNHKQIPYKVKNEVFMLTFVGDYLFQGYIDLMHNEDGDCVITDWKTSSIYKDQKLIAEAGQLYTYAIYVCNMGFPVEKIKLRWNFMKYVNVECEQANGESKIRTILRCELGKDLYSSAKMWFKKLKYNGKPTEEQMEHIEECLIGFAKTNDISCLPEDVQSKFNIEDCYVYIDCNKKVLEQFIDEVCKDLDEANRKMKEYEKSKDKMIWWTEVTDKDFYFHANLSGYSKKYHLGYAKYLDDLKKKEEENKKQSNNEEDLIKELLFGGG